MKYDELLNPVLIIDEGDEDEASLYLRHVMQEAENYKEKSMAASASMDCDKDFIPESKIPDGFDLSLTNLQKQTIIKDFEKLRDYLAE